jgi:hypothetical protein
MSNGDGRALATASPNPFEPIRNSLRFVVPPPEMERLCELARIPAHYRPTFANAISELFAKSHRWHRMAIRSVEMDKAAKELAGVAKDALKLKSRIDKLGGLARTTLGLYALRLDNYGEADSHETAREQIEELLRSGFMDQALQKVEYLSWAVGRIEAAATTETWPQADKGEKTPWKSIPTPLVHTFNRFVIELGEVVRGCNSPLVFDPAEITLSLVAFLKAATPFLPTEFVPKEVYEAGEPKEPVVSASPLKKLMFWS